uniref:Uncharacterized protein n=1 Tax=Glossina austeni TaxID=7395 RepID=A0A1A9VAW9_GLOAU
MKPTSVSFLCRGLYGAHWTADDDGRILYVVETFNAYTLHEAGTDWVGVLGRVPGDILNLLSEMILKLVLVMAHSVELMLIRTFELLMMLANTLALGAMCTSH